MHLMQLAVGGAADILVSFKLVAGQSNFGLSVRGGDVKAEVELVTATSTGFTVTMSFYSHPGALLLVPMGDKVSFTTPPPPCLFCMENQ